MVTVTFSMKRVAIDYPKENPEIEEKVRKAMLDYFEAWEKHALSFGVPAFAPGPTYGPKEKQCSCRGVMHWPDCELGFV